MKMKWPIVVTATIHSMSGKQVRLRRTVEGAGNAYGAMLSAVLQHPQSNEFLGVEIEGLTPLGQRCLGIYEQVNGEPYLKTKSGFVGVDGKILGECTKFYEYENLFDDTSDWITKNPGNIEYSCNYCGIYNASKPMCNRCEENS